MRAWAGFVVIAVLACARTKAAPSKSPESSTSATPVVGVVRRPERLTGNFSEALLPYTVSFAIPAGIEMTLSKPEVGGGYEWVSTGEPGAIIIRWHFARATDELLSGADPAGTMAGVLIESFGGTQENLVDRTVLRTPKEIAGTSWRVAAPKLTGWVAIYTNAPRRASADSEELAVEIFVIVVLGAPGSTTAFDGTAVSTIRDSVRFDAP